jgi:hypothetical protein
MISDYLITFIFYFILFYYLFLHSPGFAVECQDSLKYSLIAAIFRITFTQSDITNGEESK